MHAIIRKIKQNGIKPDIPEELKQNLEISNIFNIIDIILVIPFIILFRESPLASILTTITVCAHLLSFVLIRYHKYNVGRFIYSITTATTVYFVAALIYTDDGTDGLAAKFLILGTIIMPFIVFTNREWIFTIFALVLDLFYIISFNYLNGILNLPINHNVDTPELRILSIITTFIIFCSIFLYYKKLIVKQNLKLDKSIKELRATNDELQELNATKNKFFSIIAHDLRSPFNTILGFAELLNKDHTILNDEEMKSFSKSFYMAILNTSKTVENLLSWSRSQLNCLRISPTTIELHDFVSEMISLQREISDKKGIMLLNLIDPGLYAHADKDFSSVVIRNLISNAIKYSYRESVVSIDAKLIQEKHETFVEICVLDLGTGMNEDRVSKLFKIGNNESHRGTENEKGTGLGLLLCKEFVEKNGGKIYVTSKPGDGSKFYFTLLALKSPAPNALSLSYPKEECID